MTACGPSLGLELFSCLTALDRQADPESSTQTYLTYEIGADYPRKMHLHPRTYRAKPAKTSPAGETEGRVREGGVERFDAALERLGRLLK